MEPTKKALLATHMHNTPFNNSIRRSLPGYGFIAVATVDEALRLCAENLYDVYVVEANLEHSFTETITCFRQIYDALRAQGVEGLEQKMVAFSSTQGALDLVAELGIPAIQTTGLSGYLLTHFVDRTPQ